MCNDILFKNIVRGAIVLLLPFFFPVVAYSQYYNLGQDPAATRWNQINTCHFRIVYPVGFDTKAQEVANLFEYIHERGATTLEHVPKRVPVIIHTSDIVPNAFSIWAPKRLELYSCPPQNSYAQDWLQQLVIHEYRHVVQMDMLNRGFTKGLTWLFGQQATAAITGLFVPMWFMEGDAVSTETALSHSGRGRVPAFEMEIRAQVREKGIYSYDKAVFGSYKDFIPDQYVLGYQLVANTRKKFGYKAWVTTLDHVARKPFIITPFARGLRKATGMNKTALYKSSLQELDSLWGIQDRTTEPTSFKVLTPSISNNYTRYKFPHYLNDSLLLAERTGMDDISRFVLLDRNGNESVLYTPGFFSSDVFSVTTGSGGMAANKPGSFTVDNLSINHGWLAWTERIADPRWQNRNYSIIRLYDFSTGKTRNLTRKSRYFAPSVSPQGDKIIAVSMSEKYESGLVLIDINDGREIRSYCKSMEASYMTPGWSSDGKTVVFTELNRHGKSIVSLDVENGNRKTLLKPGFDEISNPVFAGRYVLFNGSYSGIENIYSIDTATLSLYRVTSSVYGACNASYHPGINRLVYSDYNSDGYRLVEIDFKPKEWKPLEEIEDHSISLYKALLPDESGIVDSTVSLSNIYPVKPYRKASHLINFHSWAPLFVSFDQAEAGTGLSLMSQNLLSTATTTLGYAWDYSSKTGMYKFSFLWEGWYPVLNLDVSTGDRALTRKDDEGQSYRMTWDENRVSGGIKLPLRFNHGKYYSGFQASANTTWIRIANSTDRDTNRMEGVINTLDYRLVVYNYIKQSLRDVYPKWGQSIEGNIRHTPFGDNNYGSIASVEANLFFPGFFRHSGIRLYTGYQSKHKVDYQYADLVNLPRGYLSGSNDGLFTLNLNYKFPVCYPDLALGPILYLKRLKANVFFDYAVRTLDQKNEYLQSTGLEISSDFHVFRFLLPIDAGIRTGYRMTDRKWFADFLFSVNLAF